MTPYGVSIFCDDIRFEQQNKFSLIGCYGPELIIYAPPPVGLPKLGILVQARFPLERLPTIKLNIFMPDEKEPFYTQELLQEEQDFKPSEAFQRDTDAAKDIEGQRALIFPFVFTPFVVSRTGYIRVRMLYGDSTIRVGSLKVSYQPAAPIAQG